MVVQSLAPFKSEEAILASSTSRMWRTAPSTLFGRIPWARKARECYPKRVYYYSVSEEGMVRGKR
jgi:hypothetical protein